MYYTHRNEISSRRRWLHAFVCLLFNGTSALFSTVAPTLDDITYDHVTSHHIHLRYVMQLWSRAEVNSIISVYCDGTLGHCPFDTRVVQRNSDWLRLAPTGVETTAIDRKSAKSNATCAAAASIDRSHPLHRSRIAQRTRCPIDFTRQNHQPGVTDGVWNNSDRDIRTRHRHRGEARSCDSPFPPVCLLATQTCLYHCCTHTHTVTHTHAFDRPARDK